VASLYYDSAGLGVYHEKLAGVKKRKKLRLRVYDSQLLPDTNVFIEIKRKDDALVLKDRIIISYRECYNALFLGMYEPLRKSLPEQYKELFDEFLWTKEYNCLVPKVMVTYKRCPMISKIDKKFRITFDKHLTTRTANWLSLKKGGQPVEPDYVIMEVKYNNTLPEWFGNVIKDYQLERMALSKYCMSIEQCMKDYLIINY